MIKAEDGFGEYYLPLSNAKIPYSDIADIREKNREAIDLSKRHKNITYIKLDYNMCLTRFGFVTE